jgi:hypothetical protein
MSTPRLDWTFGPAPGADENLPSAAPRRPGPSSRAAVRLSRRMWLVLGALAALALALTVALPAVENARTRQAVEQVVARQEQARLAADWESLRASYAADSLGWAVTRVLRLRNGWLPTPISLPGLRSDGKPGRVVRFQVVGPQLARADVERGFILANGAHVTFVMPQFYQFAKGAGQQAAWRQAPPPDVPTDQAQHFHGARVDLTYYPDDADLAPGLGRDLDDLLSRACADWACPPEVRVAVVFDPSDPASAASRPAFDSLFGSLTLQIILGRPSTYPAPSVNLASRVTGGYPAGAAAAEALRRTAGVRALLLVAQQLASNTLLHGENAYLDALIAREASRLGIDAPGLAQLQIANLLFQPDDLWSVPLLHYSTAGALPEALVILNHVLADRDITGEQHLMHSFNTATDVESWLAAGLGISRIDAFDALNTVYWNRASTPFPSVLQAAFNPDFALSCREGATLATLSGQSAPLLAGNLPDSFVDAWSPDGRRLALRVSGRLSVVDLSDHTGLFMPKGSFQEGILPAWASNDVLVYPASALDQDPRVALSNDGLIFAQVQDLGFDTLPNYVSYSHTPGGAWAAVVGEPFGSQPKLAIIRVLGPSVSGNPIFKAEASYNPAWSADSQRLAFALREETQVDLVVFDVATRDKRTILTSADPRVPPQPAVRTNNQNSLMETWSPAGDWLAVGFVSNTLHGVVGWAGLVAPDGNGFKLLPAARADMAPNALTYSADGRYLALDLSDGGGTQGVALYSPAGALLRWLPGFQLAAWSPAGHTLALTGLDGVSLLSEPDAEPRGIGPEGCSGLAWKP